VQENASRDSVVTNIFKRLESSGYAFLLSISRHILPEFYLCLCSGNKLPLPIGPQEANLLDEFIDDTDPDETNGSTLTLLLKEDEYLKEGKEVYKIYQTRARTSVGIG